MKKIIALLMCAGMLAAVISGCGNSSRTYKDGVYTGKSDIISGDEEGNGNGYGEVTITIKDNLITGCEFKTYEENGTLKGADYGMVDGEIKNQDYYNKAQKAVKGSEKYAENIVKTGKLDDVDSISGATYSYDQFVGAINDALDKAAQ